MLFERRITRNVKVLRSVPDGRVPACAVAFHAGMPADLSALVFHLWVLLFRFTTVGVRYCVLDAGFQVRMWLVPPNGTVHKFVVGDGSSHQMPR